ncbi:60S ribosomal protein L22 [Salpingoeca rosetta]|uniref:Large ribosomal subunit protein eL22 n=1 Tax=Salpingoeca rosetta (strain ATCC 50818 / BSB-021) TaxID=946362 RepID=F2TXD8_SALR5|nr:60S ribosomal protein L22 [Salpingoeca rosetta]EGD76047.1 60S ribosomal protein L22 [Salpingoeca rosetta]|eukprot:XP_004998222.1 60S ribosomal protein L22 [Salpingoeca rosetta]
MPAQKGAKKIATKKFTVDFSKVAEDSLVEVSEFARFLHERIKVNGKTGQLAGIVKITNTDSKVTVATKLPMSKRYIKYLTKKFLKKTKVNQEISLREYLRVVASNPTTYEVRYFNVEGAEEEEED